MLIEYHRNMLSDPARNKAFARALEKVIVPGESVVADVGSGTGFLGFIAKKLGAKEVYFFESGSIMHVAEKLARANGFNKGCHFLHGHSTDFLDPPHVDVVVSETLGNYPFEENITHTLQDARRFLKPGGVMIPQGITQYACPVVTGRFQKRFDAWDKVGFGLDYSVAKEMSLNNAYVRIVKKDDLLDAGAGALVWDEVADVSRASHVRRGAAEWKVGKAVTVYGLATWWDCLLAPGVKLSTSPMKKQGHWNQLYFPLMSPVKAKRGDVVRMEFESDSSYEHGTDMRWSVTLNGGKKQSMALRDGYLA